jgi:DNA-binding Lrp family transcriptional regulator
MEDPILEYRVLEAVHKNDGRLTQRHISEKVGRSVASVNFALRLLAVKGYIKISGANPRSFKYHLTRKGVVQKSWLAYNFLKRQSALYEEARNGVLHNLKELRSEGVKSAALYGWTPLTESAMLFLISEGIRVTALYVRDAGSFDSLNRIPVRLIDTFESDCEVLLLTEPLPVEYEKKITTRKLICFPASESDEA